MSEKQNLAVSNLRLMKKKNLRTILIVAVLAVAGIAMTMYSCEKETIVPNSTDDVTVEEVDLKSIIPNVSMGVCGEIENKNILDANRRIVGKSYIYNDKDNFVVLLTAKRGYYFGNAYLHEAGRVMGFPLNENGDPDYIAFKHRIDAQPFCNYRKFVIPASAIKDKNLISAVTQVIYNNNGREKGLGWIDGTLYGNTKKGRYFEYELKACKPNPMPGSEDAVVKKENTEDSK